VPQPCAFAHRLAGGSLPWELALAELHIEIEGFGAQGLMSR
jgi:hypothetical protein